jgi:hypothetical protein
MTVFCPGCGAKFSADPSPTDEDGTVVCPRCHSHFATSGVVATAAAEPKRKFKAKKKNAGAWPSIVIGLLAIGLLGSLAAALYFSGAFGRNSPSEIASKTPDGAVITWREYSSEEGKFKALMPGQPARIVRQRKDIEYRVDAPHVQASIVFADVPEKTNPESLMVAPHGARMISEKDVSNGGHKGREIVADIPNRGVVHMRYYLAGKRLYSVMIVGKGKPVSDADVARLFDSFQITG